MTQLSVRLLLPLAINGPPRGDCDRTIWNLGGWRRGVRPREAGEVVMAQIERAQPARRGPRTPSRSITGLAIHDSRREETTR